jgi:hypothetical protein
MLIQYKSCLFCAYYSFCYSLSALAGILEQSRITKVPHLQMGCLCAYHISTADMGACIG